MASILRNLRLNKAELLSIVDKGASGDANHRPSISLYKRASTEAPTMEKQGMTPEEILAKLPEAEREVLEAAIMAAGKPTEKADEEEKETEKADEEETEKADEEEKETEKAEDEEGLTEEEKKIADAMPEGDAKKSLIKRFKEDRQVQVEKADIAKRVEQLEAEKETQKFVGIAKRFEVVPGSSTTERAEILKSASKVLDQKHYDALISTFEKAAQVIAKGKTFEAVGSGFAPEGSAMQKVELLAKAKQDEEPTISFAKAKTLVLEKNPELYAAIKRGE